MSNIEESTQEIPHNQELSITEPDHVENQETIGPDGESDGESNGEPDGEPDGESYTSSETEWEIESESEYESDPDETESQDYLYLEHRSNSFRKLETNHNIKSITLSYSVPDKTLIKMGRAIKNNPRITSLEIRDTNINSSEAIREFFQEISSNTTIEEIEFYRNNLTDDAIVELSRGLVEIVKRPNFKKLTICEFDIETNGSLSMLDMLTYANNIEELSIILDMGNFSAAEKLYTFFSTNTSVKKILINCRNMNSEAANVFFPGLIINSTINDFYFSFTPINSDGATNLNILVQFANAIQYNNSITTLKLSNINFDMAGGEEFANAIAHNQRITKLKLQSNVVIGSVGGRILSTALISNRSIKTLEFSWVRITVDAIKYLCMIPIENHHIVNYKFDTICHARSRDGIAYSDSGFGGFNHEEEEGFSSSSVHPDRLISIIFAEEISKSLKLNPNIETVNVSRDFEFFLRSRSFVEMCFGFNPEILDNMIQHCFTDDESHNEFLNNHLKSQYKEYIERYNSYADVCARTLNALYTGLEEIRESPRSTLAFALSSVTSFMPKPFKILM